MLPPLLQKPIVGLDIGTSGIKAVEMSGGKNPTILSYNRIPLPYGTISDSGDIDDVPMLVTALKRLFKSGSFSTNKVVLGASGNSITIKKISIPKMSQKELDHQMYWEAEQYINFEVSEAKIDYAVLGNSTNSQADTPMMDVLLVAAKKDYVEKLLALTEQAGLEPSAVDSQAFALGNAFATNYGFAAQATQTSATYVIIDFGAGATKLSIVEEDKVVFTRDLSQGGVACTRLISERLGISFPEAEKLKLYEAETPHVKDCLNDFSGLCVDEIQRTLEHYVAQGNERAVQGIYYCGGAIALPGLLEAMESKLPASLFPLNPIQNFTHAKKSLEALALSEMQYIGAVAVGLALHREGK